MPTAPAATTTTVTRISRFGFVNAYLVPEADGLTLIDTMIPRSAPAILREAERLGAPIVRVALTHAHGDHIGSLDALAAALPQAQILISEREAPMLRKDLALRPGEPAAKLRGGWPGAQAQPSATVVPGDRIGSLQVVAAPGHTPGQVAFLDTRDGTLYCADAYTTVGGVATSAAVNWRFPLSTMATWDRPTALRSAIALRALDPARLAPGHGRVVDAPGAAMDAAIAKAQRGR
ncbi:MAG TPA: MBL fold metallo-hydrolase [Solirubrobacteraceae bacterium]|nr:MBL fold metallo-hydrolase [Solirubrobacteraceae bacterium]